MPRPDLHVHAKSSAWAVFLLLAAGVVFFAFDFDAPAWPFYLVTAVLAGVAAIPAISEHLSLEFEVLRRPSPRVRFVIAVLVMVISARYFLFSNNLRAGELFPVYHDEFMYLLQARMLSIGRLWMPQHPLADFFDSFFIVVKPVYAGAYFPGTALVYVPGTWLTLAPWFTGICIAGGAVMMLYLIVTRMLDGVMGLLAAILAVSLVELRIFSVMTMSHTAMMLLVLLAFWAYLRWRESKTWKWALLVGVFAGWGAITRPVDAVCLIGAIGLAMLWDLRTSGWRRAAISIGVALLGAVPFLSMQLVMDKGITGQWFRTPIAMYDEANLPGLSLGFGPREVHESPAALPQVRDYYRQFLRKDLEEHGSAGFAYTWLHDRWLPTARIAVPAHALFILIPLGLLALRSSPRWAIAAGVFTLPLAYTFFPIYLHHYSLAAVPAFLMLMLLAIDEIRRRFRSIGPVVIIAVAVLAISTLPELRGGRDRFFVGAFMNHVNYKLNQIDHLPAVVLFRYETNKAHVHEEPVYNIERAWPDDCEIIRAHDLGERNREIFEYYAKRQPQRFFYFYDRSKPEELKPLGYAKELAGKGSGK